MKLLCEKAEKAYRDAKLAATGDTVALITKINELELALQLASEPVADNTTRVRTQGIILGALIGSVVTATARG